MATFVLVHGGSHGGWCWQRLSPLLRQAGHDVYAPTLTGLADRAHLLTPSVDLDTHITDIARLLSYEDLTDVILVGHSYAGMVITGVADRALGRVGHLVYLDAARPRHGEAQADISPTVARLHDKHRVVDGVDLVMFPGATTYFGVTDSETIEWMRPKLTPHPWKCFTQPVTIVNQAAVDAVPRSFINCTETLALRPDWVRQRLTGTNVWEVDLGHDLMISDPEVVAGMLLEVAAA